MCFPRRLPFAHVLWFDAELFTRSSAFGFPPSNPRGPGRQAVHKEEKYPSTYKDNFFGKILQVFENIFFKTGLKPDFERYLASMAVDHARRDRHALRLAYGPPCE